jgi:hypothetical protein
MSLHTDWFMFSPAAKEAWAIRHAKRRKHRATCVERGCQRPAGTPWTPVWCWVHDEERRDRITAKLEAMGRRETSSTQRSPGTSDGS